MTLKVCNGVTGVSSRASGCDPGVGVGLGLCGSLQEIRLEACLLVPGRGRTSVLHVLLRVQGLGPEKGEFQSSLCWGRICSCSCAVQGLALLLLLHCKS